MRRAALSLILSATFLVAQPAQAPAARDLLGAATAKGRPVLVAFHASWCSWCRRLEALLQRPEVAGVLDRHLTVQWLTVQERPGRAHEENPGASELYRTWSGGTPVGIPFCVILDAKGSPLATSLRTLTPGGKLENLGYPGTPEEIRAFVAFLKEGAPSLSPGELAALEQAFAAARPGVSAH